MRYKPLLLAAAPLLLASCTVGPNYLRPEAPLTPAYKEPLPEAYKNAGIWIPAHPSDHRLRANWWELFGDAQLDAEAILTRAWDRN